MSRIKALCGTNLLIGTLFCSLSIASLACEVEPEDGIWNEGSGDGEDDSEDAGLRAWTGYTSEELAPLECAPGRFVRGVNCQGSYCDNVALDCVTSGAAHGASSWTSFFSEEGNGAADERHCAWGDFVTGIQCSGSYCDNISLRCTDAIGKTFGTCQWSGWYSEETGPFQTPAGRYIKGVECDGSYCDNKRYMYCQMI